MMVLHVPFYPSDDPSSALKATPGSALGATEVVFYYFPSPLPEVTKSSIMDSITQLRPVVERSEALTVLDGWAIEEAVPTPRLSKGEPTENKQESGVKGLSTVYVNLVGWVDVDAHRRFQASEDFKANIHLLLGIKELKGTEMYHAKFYKV